MGQDEVRGAGFRDLCAVCVSPGRSKGDGMEGTN